MNMTKAAMSEKLSNFVEHYGSAFIVGMFQEKELIYTNQTAVKKFGITTETKDLDPLFPHITTGMTQMVLDGLKNANIVTRNNLPVVNIHGEIINCNVQFGYFDADKREIFVEINPLPDNRMESAIAQVDQSSRAEGILHFDEKLSLFYCNDLFHQVFESNEDVRQTHYNNNFSNGFQPDQREKILAEIHETLKNSHTYSTKMKVVTATGLEKWYSLELQKRTLDDSGQEKIMAYLINIEKEVEKEIEFEENNQYFNILQSLCKVILYRFDLKTKTLYRNEEASRVYNAPRTTENFPSKEWLDEFMHPDDVEETIAYGKSLAEGKECTLKARVRVAENLFEYHNFIFKPVYRDDGSVKEMVGSAVNIQEKHDLESIAKNVKKQFDILERVCEDRLSFIDFKTRVIIHNEAHAAEVGIDTVEEQFPDTIIPRVHPEDLDEFKKFAQSNLDGNDGTFTFRMRINATDYQWFEVTSYIIRDETGTPEQIVSRVKNVNTFHELQSKVTDFNKQFDILEKISQETMIQVDINSKVLVHRGSHAALTGVNDVEENFPECAYPRIHPEDLDQFKEYAHSIMSGNEGNLTFRMKVVDRDSPYEWFEWNCFLIYDSKGKPEQIVGTIKNVHSHQEMIKRANTDLLTGSLNKMATLEQVSEILASSNEDAKHALLFLDLDDFKYVNDNLGHAFGDFLLKELGKRLSENIRAQDLVGRVGGDEFVLFLQNIPNKETLLGKGKIILSSISEDFVEGDNKHNIKGSMGIAVYPDHGTTYEELYHHADIALYQSKHKGKNTVNIFSFDPEKAQD